MHECPKCQSDRVINNGSAAGKPKKRCQQCGCQFTRTTSKEMVDLTMALFAKFWVDGNRMNSYHYLLETHVYASST